MWEIAVDESSKTCGKETMRLSKGRVRKSQNCIVSKRPARIVLADLVPVARTGPATVSAAKL